MNKKYIFSFVLFSFCLLLNVSYALPDFYIYENFLAGISPYSINEFADVDEQFVSYDANLGKIGFVASFDNVSMTGDSRKTAVPLYNLDQYSNNKLLIPTGECIAVYSKGCSLDNVYVRSDGSRVAIPIGSISPSGVYMSPDFLNASDSVSAYIDDYENFSDTSFTIDFKKTSSDSLQLLPDSSTTSNNPFPNSRVWLIYAYDSPTWVYGLNGAFSTLTELEVETVSFNSLEWFAFGLSTDPEKIECVFLPYINGDIDIYVNKLLTNVTSEYISYAGKFRFNLTATSIDYKNRLLTVSIQNVYDNRIIIGEYPLSLYSNGNNNLIPAFIHSYNASRYNSQYAIYVYDGYFSVQNYDELIQKLKDAGFGQSGSSVDLSRIEELLEEINSGGENGQVVKELIETIEGLENQVFDNLDTTEIFSTWDTYKSLLDFSSLNWLIVANNRMFEIFCGVIVLSVIFIVFDRCLR